MPFSANALTRRSVVSWASAGPAPAIAAATRPCAASLLIAFMTALSWSKVKGPPMLAPAAVGPALGADERHEHHAAEIGLAKAAAFARQLDQALRAAVVVDRHDEA